MVTVILYMYLMLKIHSSHGAVIHVCSSNSPKLNCSLEFYASNIPNANNTVMILDKGTHRLHLNKSVRFDSLKNFSIIGRGKTISERASNSYSTHWTKIQCAGSGMSGLFFSNIQDLYISGFSIVNCGSAFLNDLSTSAGLVIRETFNASIEDVIVKNCAHFGMVGLNMLGFTRIQDSLFISNSISNTSEAGGNMLLSWSSADNDQCKSILFQINRSQFIDGYGDQNRAGGLHIDYQNPCNTKSFQATISITASIFTKNYGGNMKVVVHQVSQRHHNSFHLHLIRSEVRDGISSDNQGSGGLSFMFEKNTVAVHDLHLSEYKLVVNDSVLSGNTNIYSSGSVLLNTSLMNGGKLSASFYNCSFINNSGIEGGALSLHLYSVFTNVILSSCVFYANIASQGGAIFSKHEASLLNTSLSNSRVQSASISILDCTFRHNLAFESGSALFVDDHLSGNSSVLNLVMNNTEIEQNKVTSSSQMSDTIKNNHQQPDSVNATVVIKCTNTFISNSSLSGNIGSAIYAAESKLHFDNVIVISSNSATVGGGIQLQKAKLFLSMGTRILFKNNHADHYGGAIYVSERQQGCFLMPSSLDPFPGEVPQIAFENNSAEYSGDIFYGSKAVIDSCFTNNDTATTMFIFQDQKKLSTTLSLTSELESKTRVCMCSSVNIPNCETVNVLLEVFPGAVLSLPVATLDNDEMVARAVTAELQNDLSYDNVSSSLLGGHLQMTQKSCTQLNYTLSSQSTSEIMTLTIADYSRSMVNPLKVFVHLLPCPLGFSIQHASSKCDCIPLLTQLGVACNIQDQTFEHYGSIWIGYVQ